MPSKVLPGIQNEVYEITTRSREFHQPTMIHKQDGITRTFDRPPVRTNKRWPPPPSVEDEELSLSREQSPTLPELQDGDAQMKGTVDQMPILFEIGKENEDVPVQSGSKKKKQETRQRYSSDDSYGPDTPNDSSASESNRTRRYERPPDQGKLAPSPAAHNLVNQQQSYGRSRSRSTRLPERPPPKLVSPRAATFHQSSSNATDMHPVYQANRLYPGTLEELKNHPREGEHLGYAQRQRTMSGSNNAADHRPANIRHMSAMGYSGESQTPSFPRDHPALHPAAIASNANSVPPRFRQPRDKDHDAIVDSSDSDISPDEMYDRNSRQRRTYSKSQPRSEDMYGRPPRPPSKESNNQHSRPSSSEQRSGQNTVPITSQAHRRQESREASTKPSPVASLGTSPYPSPPASPRSTSRPSSRDGPNHFLHSTINSKTQPLKRTSRPSSPIRGGPSSEAHVLSNLRYSSRPSSPLLQTSKEGHDQNFVPKSEGHGARRDALKPETRESRESSPVPVTRPPVSPRLGLRVDPQPNEKATTKIPTSPNVENRQRPFNSDGSSYAFIPSPAVTISNLHRTPSNSNSNSQDKPSNLPKASAKPAKPNKTRTQLISCPRPGFTTKYNDWWTIPQIPALDICPQCVQSLQSNGFDAKFIRSQSRPAGTQTRCDMNVSWVRIACILILSGREDLDILKELMDALAMHDPCPQDRPTIKKKWYRVYDDDADKHVSGFSICPSCVESIRVLFPNLKGTFKSHVSTVQDVKICNLSASVTRFAKYVDLLDNISSQARSFRETPDTKGFIRMTRDFAGIPPCTQDNQYRGKAWHFTSHIPDFTICEECFMEVVRPAQRSGYDVAEQINRKKAIPRDADRALSCQLYSPRMRAIFEESCRLQNIASLKEHASIRIAKERELQHRFSMAQGLPTEQQEQTMEILIEEWKRWQ